jgi:serine/threonine-protein kinase RsbW
MTEERTFSNDAASVTAARRWVLHALGDVAPTVADAVALMVSELSANAVRHSGTQFTLSIDATSARIRVSVADSGPGRPVVRSPEPTEPSGRGLQIVEALADEWGIDSAPEGQGKTVWFTIGAPDGVDEPAQLDRELDGEGIMSESTRSSSMKNAPPASTPPPSRRGRRPRARASARPVSAGRCPNHTRLVTETRGAGR